LKNRKGDGCPFPVLPLPYPKKVEAKMSEVRLSFKEMCARFDVTPRTLRYYEYIELLSPDREGRSRFYGPRELARMTLILRGRKFGFQLEELRQWLLIYDQEGTKAQMNVFLDMADRKLAELRDQQVQLSQTIEELEQLRQTTVKLVSS
jgi:DNA-binding transcriptional MerR regulator